MISVTDKGRDRRDPVLITTAQSISDSADGVMVDGNFNYIPTGRCRRPNNGH